MTVAVVLAWTTVITVTAQTTVKVSLDSAYVLMGNATPLNIELSFPASAQGALVIPPDTLGEKVEILESLPADTSESNGRVTITQKLLLQSFDSGTYILQPILYVSGTDTVASNRPVLKVIPADVDSLTTIHDYADVRDVNRKLVDYLPDFLADYGAWLLALALVLLLAYYTWRRLTGRREETMVQAKQLPPYETAAIELTRLNSENLCQQGREREFYTRLTDILRQYLQGRFGINAMEMTSTQIRSMLQANEQTRMSKPLMDTVLETADFVKYAKMRPLPDDNVKAFDSARNFVEETRPSPEPDTNGSAPDNDKTNSAGSANDKA